MVLVIRQYQRRKNSQKKLVNPAIKLELKKGRLECKALIFFLQILEKYLQTYVRM